MSGGGAEKAIDQLLAAINQGKDLPRRYQPGVTLGFPDLDVFTPEALERIKALTGGDPARTARLSAHVLKIAQRECAVPVLPDLVEDAAAQIDLQGAESEETPPPQRYEEHWAPQVGRRPVAPQGLPLAEPSARHDPGLQTRDPQTHDPQTRDPQTGGLQTGGVAPGVSAARRRVRPALLVLGVVLLAAGVAGSLAYTGQLDTFGDTRKIVTASLAAIGVVPPEGHQQEDRSGDRGASSPAEPTAESEPPAEPSGGAAVPESDDRDETPNEAVAAGHPLRENDRRADEAVLAEQWPEMGETAENAIKQRFREVREQTEQARQALEEIGSEMEQLHRRQREEMQVRHTRELSQAGAEGADAVAQAKDRHQQERAALQRDQEANRESLAAVHDKLDQQLQSARRDVAQARKDAAAAGQGESREPHAISRVHLHEQPGAPVASSPVVAPPPEEGIAAGSVTAESGLQPQSDQTDDRQQQSVAAIAESAAESDPEPGVESGIESGAESGKRAGESPGEIPGTGVVAWGQPEPPQDEASEPAAPQTAQRSRNEEEPRAGQPLPPTRAPSPSAEPGAANSAAGTAAPDAAEAAEGQPATESPPATAPAGQDVANLVNRGNALLDLGDLASARLFYRLAADGGSPEGAMLMGMTFDPVYFSRTGIQGTRPQIRDALHWYDKAIAMGSRPAERRMEELRSWLERSAATGDARARTALEQLR